MKNITAYFTPTSLSEAVRLLREQPGKGKFIAGGTNLVVEKDPALDFLIDVHQLGLDYITVDADYIRIGACTTLERIYHSPLTGSLASGLLLQVASWFGSKQIRNVATLGGNLADGHSAADTIPALLALDALVVLVGTHERVLPVADFLQPRGGTVLQQELIKEVLLPRIFQRASGKFLKQAKTREDIAMVSVTTTAIMQENRCHTVRIALGAVAPTPIRIPDAEAVLHGHIPTPALIRQAADMVRAQIHPLDNFRATAAFRKAIAHVFTRRTLAACFNLVNE